MVIFEIMRKSIQAFYDEKITNKILAYDDSQANAVTLLSKINDDLSKRNKRFFSSRKKSNLLKGVYFWGGVGRGKSMIMDLFFSCSSIKKKRRVHFHAFMQEIHEKVFEVRKTGVSDAIEPIAKHISKTTDLLCFDELQITDITDAMIIGRLFDRITNYGVFIVATSNRPPEDLYKDGLNRNLFLPFISFVQRDFEVFEFTAGVDYRRLGLTSKKRFFSPINEKSKFEVDTIWESFLEGPPSELKLRLKSRSISIAKFINGVGRMEFEDLCNKPLGPADFLAIANSVRVLIIDNIPKLGREQNNQAKRFVTLIDVLYEQKVILVASAATIPEKIFELGEGSFEFERTASRISEMQSEDWGL